MKDLQEADTSVITTLHASGIYFRFDVGLHDDMSSGIVNRKRNTGTRITKRIFEHFETRFDLFH